MSEHERRLQEQRITRQRRGGRCPQPTPGKPAFEAGAAFRRRQLGTLSKRWPSTGLLARFRRALPAPLG
jgi:hypothetical protein